MTLKLGLTGSIATGKSTILKMFEERGVPVFSSDAAVHQLYSGEAVAPVEALFPGVAVDGAIDRTRLSAILVAEPARIRELEAVVHPLVRARIARFLAEAEAAKAPIAVVDIPLLFENGYEYGLDAVAVTHCRPQTQRLRALARTGMSGEKLDAILARQTRQEEKLKRADYAFDTDRPLASLEDQVARIVASAEKGR